MDATDKLLEALERLREELRAELREQREELKRLEKSLSTADDLVKGQVKGLQDRVHLLEKRVGELEEQLQSARRDVDNARVTGEAALHAAMRITEEQITGVKTEVKALRSDVAGLTKAHSLTAKETTAQTELLKTIAHAVVTPKLRKAIWVVALIGGLIGGGVAGYMAARGGPASTQIDSR